MTRVLALTKYGSLGASSRLRFLQYVPWLKSAGIDVEVRSLLNDEILARKYRVGRYPRFALVAAYFRRIRTLRRRRKFDLLWIEKEAFPWLPLSIELRCLDGVPFVLDYDDAVFHTYDENRSSLVRHLFGERLDHLMAEAKLVVAGNDYLATRAQKVGAAWIEIVPTVIDLERYPAQSREDRDTGEVVIGWIGSPSTATYLHEVSDVLSRVKLSRNIRCVAIGVTADDVAGTSFEAVPWSEDTEVSLLHGMDVGIMPLRNTRWEQGKCGYKLIQYMASRLPVVASPVGANCQIVKDRETGFLAKDEQAWVDAIETLVDDSELRIRMGTAGRERVEKEYCLQSQGPRLAAFLRDSVVG